MIPKTLGRALCALLACALMPAAALAQTATPTTTLPRGIFEPSGRSQVQTQPVAIIGYDSVTSAPCIIGSAVTCLLPGTGGGGGGGGGAVTIADGAAVPLGARADAACASDTATCTQISLAKRELQRLTTAIGHLSAIQTAAEDPTSVAVKGAVAPDAPFTEAPLPGGCRASTAPPTAVSADGDMVALRCDLYGNLIARMAPVESAASGAITTPMTATTPTQLLAAPGAGLRNYVTSLACYNTSASVDTLINVQDGSGGTVIHQLAAKASFGGAVLTFPFPLRQPTANTGLFVVNGTTGASTTCVASGFRGP